MDDLILKASWNLFQVWRSTLYLYLQQPSWELCGDFKSGRGGYLLVGLQMSLVLSNGLRMASLGNGQL